MILQTEVQEHSLQETRVEKADFSQSVTSRGTCCHVSISIANFSKFQNLVGKWFKLPSMTRFQGVFRQGALYVKKIPKFIRTVLMAENITFDSDKLP